MAPLGRAVGSGAIAVVRGIGHAIHHADGRLVIIGLLGGSRAELPLGLMMAKRLRVIGSTLRARAVAAKATVMDALKTRVWPLLEDGSIKPIIEQELAISQAAEAHELIAGNQTFGKVVLTIGAG